VLAVDGVELAVPVRERCHVPLAPLDGVGPLEPARDGELGRIEVDPGDAPLRPDVLHGDERERAGAAAGVEHACAAPRWRMA
jgi:hypothetical protein